MPRIFARDLRASSGVLASFTPPALPRPPACTCAFTTTVPPNLLRDRLGLVGRRRDLAGRNRNALRSQDAPSPDTRECSRVLRMRRVVHAVIVVPASPCTACPPALERRDDRARPRRFVRRTKSIAARIFGAMLPSPKALCRVHVRRLVDGELRQADAAAAFPTRRRPRRRRSESSSNSAPRSRASTAATRSLSTTASIPSQPSVGCR